MDRKISKITYDFAYKVIEKQKDTIDKKNIIASEELKRGCIYEIKKEASLYGLTFKNVATNSVDRNKFPYGLAIEFGRRGRGKPVSYTAIANWINSKISRGLWVWKDKTRNVNSVAYAIANSKKKVNRFTKARPFFYKPIYDNIEEMVEKELEIIFEGF